MILATSRNSSSATSDQDLQRRVVLFVQQPHLTLGAQLTVEASGGVVTLCGTVTSLQQRDLLHRFARRVAGVVRLVDELAVIPPN